MKKPFFVSDMHFGHKNIIDFCNRPYASVADMNDALINNWNKRVAMDDHIFVLGDTSFLPLHDTIQIFDSLKGVKHLVWGNHDQRYRHKEEFCKRFVQLSNYCEIQVQDGDKHQHVVLCHYPILAWNRMRYGSWMLHGHSHGATSNTGLNRYDVGVDCNDYAPVHYDEIKAKIWAPVTNTY